MTTGPRKSVTITLSPANLLDLDAMAKEAGCTRSSMVEVLLRSVIEEQALMQRVLRDASASAALARLGSEPAILRAVADAIDSQKSKVAAAAAQGTLFKRRKVRA